MSDKKGWLSVTNGLLSKTVLVFGEDTRSFLSVIRSLSRAGMLVDVVTFNNLSVSLRSNAIRNTYRYNYQAFTPQQWLDSVKALLEREHYDLVIPCDERALFPLFELRRETNLSSVFALPDESILLPLFNKHETRKLAQACQIPVARGGLISPEGMSFADISEKYQLPLVMKPVQSYAVDDLSKRLTVHIVRDEAGFNKIKTEAGDADVLVESFFEGVGVGVSVLVDRGQIKAVFAHVRVAEPRSGGGSSYRKAIPVDSGMLAAVEKFCAELQYTGVAMFEFKQNEQTRSWILIEVNSRFWGSLPLAIAAGVDFPKLYAQLLLLGTVEQSAPYNQQAYARALSNDIYDMQSEYERINHHEGGVAARKQLLSRIWGFRRLLTGNESIDSFVWSDQKPFWSELYQLLEGKLTRLPLIRAWLKARRLSHFRSQLKKPVTTVQMVCYGNIMRSPFAEKQFSKSIQHTPLQALKVESFGFHHKVGRPAPAECVEMAKHWEIDLGDHQSQKLSFENISDGSLVVIFDKMNEYNLKSYYPECRYICLADLLPDSYGFMAAIEDPYDATPEYLGQCYKAIADGLENLKSELLLR